MSISDLGNDQVGGSDAEIVALINECLEENYFNKFAKSNSISLTSLPGVRGRLLESIVISADLLSKIITSHDLARSDSCDMGAWAPYFEDDRLNADQGSSISIALDALIGPIGLQPPSIRRWKEFISFLAPIDTIGLLKALRNDSSYRSQVRLTDLGTIMDLSFIAYSLQLSSLQKKIRVLEVGGGYGRLAEGLFSAFPNSIEQYVLVDGVPGSLAAAYEYLSRIPLLSGRVELVTEGEVPSSALVAIVPDWNEFALSRLFSQDLFVNIESFQEMATPTIHRYLEFADRLLAPGGVAYLSNSRAYRNQDIWHFPESWKLQFSGETPRSWSIQHPTQIWQLPPVSSQSTFADLRRSVEVPWRQPGQVWA